MTSSVVRPGAGLLSLVVAKTTPDPSLAICRATTVAVRNCVLMAIFSATAAACFSMACSSRASTCAVLATPPAAEISLATFRALQGGDRSADRPTRLVEATLQSSFVCRVAIIWLQHTTRVLKTNQ